MRHRAHRALTHFSFKKKKSIYTIPHHKIIQDKNLLRKNHSIPSGPCCATKWCFFLSMLLENCKLNLLRVFTEKCFFVFDSLHKFKSKQNWWNFGLSWMFVTKVTWNYCIPVFGVISNYFPKCPHFLTHTFPIFEKSIMFIYESWNTYFLPKSVFPFPPSERVSTTVNFRSRVRYCTG